MALISDEDISRVIEANDIVQVAAECIPDLKQKGGRYLACCPFHKEKTPSFQIDQNKQLWHCFGCGEGGNIVTFVEKIYDMNFPEAINFLANKANIQLQRVASDNFDKSKKAKLLEACMLATKFYHDKLLKDKSAACNNARKYLSERQMGLDVAKRWNLGYAPGNNLLLKFLMSNKIDTKDMIDANLVVKRNDGKLCDRFFNRIMFPIKDAQSNIIAFGGRVIDDSQPKYLNTGETSLFHKSKTLYGLDKAKVNMTASGIAVVVEGYTDVISMHESGINYAVATLGTALTQQHVRLLNQHARKKIIYLFDGDEAGQRAAERALNFIDQLLGPKIDSSEEKLLALTLPDNLDPKEFIDKYGKNKLLNMFDEAKPLLKYGIDRKISKYDTLTPGGKSRAVSDALQILVPIKESMLAKSYCLYIAEKTSMRASDLIDHLSRLKKGKVYDDYLSDQKHKITYESCLNETSKTSSLEKELLCIFAKNPDKLKEIICDEFSYEWHVDSHNKLFEFMVKIIEDNPHIKAKELIMKIHQKNAQAANMLTKMSTMYDIKKDPVCHAKFILYSLYIDQIDRKINSLKNDFKNMNDGKDKDDLFVQIADLQKQKNIKQNLLKGII